ncbi:nitroreductase family protein [Amycolatopsis sp. FBCC-B4732]|uniref:nitroreductase family protein n=1 Tax=Amycolatopsis sp. FBCC-B4732 TaxID=3079339 RepID=UPI0037C196A4
MASTPAAAKPCSPPPDRSAASSTSTAKCPRRCWTTASASPSRRRPRAAEYGHLVEERALKTADFGSAHPAVRSFQLALRARGLGSSSCGYHLQDHESDVAALLGIPDDVTKISLLAVAYPTQRDFRPAARPAVRDIAYFDAWERTGSLG